MWHQHTSTNEISHLRASFKWGGVPRPWEDLDIAQPTISMVCLKGATRRISPWNTWYGWWHPNTSWYGKGPFLNKHFLSILTGKVYIEVQNRWLADTKVGLVKGQWFFHQYGGGLRFFRHFFNFQENCIGISKPSNRVGSQGPMLCRWRLGTGGAG